MKNNWRKFWIWNLCPMYRTKTGYISTIMDNHADEQLSRMLLISMCICPIEGWWWSMMIYIEILAFFIIKENFNIFSCNKNHIIQQICITFTQLFHYCYNKLKFHMIIGVNLFIAVYYGLSVERFALICHITKIYLWHYGST